MMAVVAGVCGAAAPARAQSQADYRAEVQRLAPIWRSVTAAGRREDSLRVRALPNDTMHIAALSVLVGPGFAALARAAAESASAGLRARFGASTEALRTHLFTLTRQPDSPVDSSTVNVGEVDTLGRVSTNFRTPATVPAVSESWMRRGALVLTSDLGPSIERWLNGPIPVDTATRDDWVGVRIDVVTSSFQASRDCYGGNLTSCERALGVVDERSPARSWYTPEERRDLVRKDGYALRRGQEDEFARCVAHDAADACTALAAQIPEDEVQAPLGTASRQSLIDLAMQLGGPGAYARMLAAPDDRGGKLTAAAAIPLDSLVARWRDKVVLTEAPQTTMTPGLALMSLVWVTTCGALALGSSRWR